MKPKHLLFLLTTLLSTSLWAQRVGGPTPPAGLEGGLSRYTEALPAGTIFYEGFENTQRPALPAGWTTQTNAEIGFVTSTAGDAIGQTNENGFWPVPHHGIFAVSNDDVCNCDKSQDRLTSPTFNASSLERLTLRFDAFQNGSGTQKVEVQAKANGSDWETLYELPNRAEWTSYDVRIPEHLLRPGFQFRFDYDDLGNYASGVALDDILLTTASIENLSLVQFYLVYDESPVQGTGQLPQQIPVRQARNASWIPAARVLNTGSGIKNAIATMSVSGSIDSVLSSANWLVEQGQENVINAPLDAHFTPHLIGDYEYLGTITTDSNDEVTTDNTIQQSFSVTDSTYQWVSMTTTYSLGSWLKDDGDRMASSFYIYRPDTARAAYVNIHPSSEDGAQFSIKFFKFGTLNSSVFSSEVITIGEEDIGGVIRVPLNAALDQARYLMAIEKEAGDERLVIALHPTRRATNRNAMSKKFAGSWVDSPYFPQSFLTFDATRPCDAYVLYDLDFETCFGAQDGSIDLEVLEETGMLNYTWSNGGPNAPSIDGLEGGIYDVTISSTSGCTYEESFELITTDSLSIDPLVINDSCSRGVGEISLNINGGTAPFTYAWNDGPSAAERRMLDAGTYEVSITDINGCTSTKTIELLGSDALNASFNIALPACNDTNGSIEALISGTAPFHYAWSSGDSTALRNGLSAGVYTLTISDSIGCDKVEEVFLSNTGAPSISTTSKTDVSCVDSANGAINITIGGGSTPYSYAWTNGSNMEDLSNVAAGVYTLTVTDAAGCLAFHQDTLIENSTSLWVDLNERGNYCWQDSNGILALIVNGGATPYNILWSNGSTDEMLSDLPSGDYGVTVTDELGCSKTQNRAITAGVPFFVELDSAIADDTASVLFDGSIYISAFGGTQPYSYLWNDSIAQEDLQALPDTFYQVEVTDQLGCVQSLGITLGGGPLSIAKVDAVQPHLSVYPNPSIQGGTINFKAPTGYNWLRVYDALGRLIRDEASTELMMPLNFGRGIFILKAMNKNGEELSTRLIVL